MKKIEKRVNFLIKLTLIPRDDEPPATITMQMAEREIVFRLSGSDQTIAAPSQFFPPKIPIFKLKNFYKEINLL